MMLRTDKRKLEMMWKTYRNISLIQTRLIVFKLSLRNLNCYRIKA